MFYKKSPTSINKNVKATFLEKIVINNFQKYLIWSHCTYYRIPLLQHDDHPGPEFESRRVNWKNQIISFLLKNEV